MQEAIQIINGIINPDQLKDLLKLDPLALEIKLNETETVYNYPIYGDKPVFKQIYKIMKKDFCEVFVSGFDFGLKLTKKNVTKEFIFKYICKEDIYKVRDWKEIERIRNRGKRSNQDQFFNQEQEVRELLREKLGDDADKFDIQELDLSLTPEEIVTEINKKLGKTIKEKVIEVVPEQYIEPIEKEIILNAYERDRVVPMLGYWITMKEHDLLADYPKKQIDINDLFNLIPRLKERNGE
jgi:hypothetical protein